MGIRCFMLGRKRLNPRNAIAHELLIAGAELFSFHCMSIHMPLKTMGKGYI